MSNVARVAGQAANTLTKPLEVEEVFSTYLYTGTNATQTITNGIDLDGEGGLVWVKWRSGAVGSGAHVLVDTERGVNYWLSSSATSAQNTTQNSVTAFNSNGFSIVDAGGKTNYSGDDYASWTFRKAPKFFDVVTYTGDGVAGREIAHNLGSVPGFIIVKKTNASGDWIIQHRSLGAQGSGNIRLNSTDAAVSNGQHYWGNGTVGINPTSSVFTVDNHTWVNNNGDTYVAYLFAHNDGDGDFGPDADADIIKCGSYLNSSSADVHVDLGWEPQWVLVRNITDASPWTIQDNMRGLVAYEDANYTKKLEANSTAAETDIRAIQPTATGFYVQNSIDGAYNSGNATGTRTHIYIAIRRGTKVPESATEVFAVSDRKNEIPGFPSGFPVDFLIGPRNSTGDNNEVKTRLISSGYLRTNTTGAENISDQSANFAHNDGFFNFAGANANQYSWMWKRAPKYMDVVAYQGTGVAGFTFNHNLGVKPEMIWVKNRGASEYWAVYHKDLNGGTNPSHYFLKLNDTNAETDYNEIWNDTEPTDTQVTVGQQGVVNSGSFSHIAYLFATLAGISKVGSVTHSGTTNVDCGFSSGSRFVLLKRTDAAGDWYVWDSERGIVSGNDPYLLLNTNAAQVTNTDYIDPLSSGFTITDDFTDGDYIFYAIA